MESFFFMECSGVGCHEIEYNIDNWVPRIKTFARDPVAEIHLQEPPSGHSPASQAGFERAGSSIAT
jgi:hypothetical protein